MVRHAHHERTVKRFMTHYTSDRLRRENGVDKEETEISEPEGT